MERLACVDVMALPLQLLGHRHPSWVDEPMAVVDRDEPNGQILWVNKAARRRRVRPGMRYGEGLSRCRSLRAGTVDPEDVDAAVEALVAWLRDWSPFVEPSDRRPGVFWADAGGLEGLYDSMQAWAEGLIEALRERKELYATVIVGFTRFGTWAVARATRGVAVFDRPEAERRKARGVPLGRLGLEAGLVEELERLGVETLGAFLRLPAGGVRRRFGARALRLHRRARGDLQLPLQGAREDGPITRRVELEDDVQVTTRLVFAVKRALNPVLAELADRSTKIAAIGLELIGREGTEQQLEVRPATPTGDVGRLMELVRLRLEDRSLEAGVVAIELTVRPQRTEAGQLHLFGETPERDVSDANRAIERLRAEFGARSVVRAVEASGHLPETSFEWEPMERLERPDPPAEPERAGLIRRVWETPRPLPWRAEAGPPRSPLPPGAEGAVLGGPFVICGGWWVRSVHRHYLFVERESGAIEWIFWDRRRQRWFVHGRVE